ncbi:MAG TPA: type II toxin-antitoxin system prevent-host-death family antitoxin [Streptosporangiaceae bacterium]
MAMMTISEARAALPEVLDRVAGGEEVTITRHGRPVAVVIRPDILWARRAGGALDDANRIHELLTGAAAAPLPAEAAATEPAETGPAETGPAAAGTGLTAERAEELIAAIRAGRDAR